MSWDAPAWEGSAFPTVPVQLSYAPNMKRKRVPDGSDLLLPVSRLHPVKARRRTTLPIMDLTTPGSEQTEARALTCLADSVPWRDRCAFVQQLKALMQNPLMAQDQDTLSHATARLIQRHMVNLNQVSGADPRMYQDANMNLELVHQLGRGSFGMVWSGTLQQHGAVQDVVVKLILSSQTVGQAETANQVTIDQFMNELMMQALLHCVANSIRLVPNPIPAVLAPIMLHDPLNDAPGIVMEHAGRTLEHYILHDNDNPVNLWVVLAQIAHALRELQRAAGFQHADLHVGNILVGRRLASVTMSVAMPQLNDPFVGVPSFSIHTPLVASIIDFGFTCMTIHGAKLQSIIRQPDKHYVQQCHNQTDSSDLFLLLASIYEMLAKTGLHTQGWTQVMGTLDAFLERALALSGILGVPQDLFLPTALPGQAPNKYALMNSVTGTSPNDVLALCHQQLQAAHVPQTGAP